MINLYIPLQTTLRPNRLDTKESNKDEKYHIEFANWCAYSGGTVPAYTDHMDRIEINKKFILNKQWFLDEDALVFLKDDEDKDIGRLRTQINYIQQMANVYKSYASKIDFTVRARSYSPFVHERKNDMLAQALMYTFIAQDVPHLAHRLKKDLPIGNDEQETTTLFEDLYKDKFVEECNNLLEYSEEVNKFRRLQSEFAEDIFYSGMCISKPYIHSGEYLFRRVVAERFFFDRTSKEYDLSDANYMGEIDFMLPTDIYERYQSVSIEDKKKIENMMRMQSDMTYVNEPNQNRSGRVPVLVAYWRDGVKDKFGYVKDEFGQNILRRLNFQADEYDVMYTESDCVSNKELSDHERKVLKVKKGDKSTNTTFLYVDQWRFCEYIPVVWTGIDKAGNVKSGDYHDICLDYGILPYGEKDLYSPSNMRTPYKVGQYMYIDGETIAPCDIVINPQRMINRITSVLENQINHAGLSGMMIDETIVEDAEDAAGKIKRGETVFVNPRGMQIQNAAAPYNALPNRQAADLVNYVNVFKEHVEQMSGMRDLMSKVSGDQLVGTMQILSQQGSLIREPFFNALSSMYEDMYQAVLTSGRRVYIDNEKQLIHIVGDEVKVFKLTEDLKWEDFRVKLVRTDNPEKERMNVDTLIIQYANPQMNYLDDVRAANLLHRASMDDLSRAVREYAKEKQQMKKMQEQQSKAQAMAVFQKQEQDKQLQLQIMQSEKQREDMNNEKDRIAKFDRDALKSHTKMVIEELKQKGEVPDNEK